MVYIYITSYFSSFGKCLAFSAIYLYDGHIEI